MALIRDADDTPLTVHPIRLLPDPVLRRKAVRVPAIDASIHRLIEDMIESMYAANGVGLAAPQIGVSLRVVVIGMPEEEPFALINPEIVKRSGERTVDEGCLSLPGYRGELTRSTLVIAKALDPIGKAGAHQGEGQPARPGARARDRPHQRHALRRPPAEHGRAAPHRPGGDEDEEEAEEAEPAARTE